MILYIIYIYTISKRHLCCEGKHRQKSFASDKSAVVRSESRECSPRRRGMAWSSNSRSSNNENDLGNNSNLNSGNN